MVMQIGLTGGIASGKSAVAALLARHGAVIIDSDLLAREVVAAGTPGLAAIVARFGTTILGADGCLDRPALGRLVFADQAARRDLEAIIHPAVRARAAELVAEAPADSVVVQVIPLLVEVGLVGAFDLVLVVDVEPETQLTRLQRREGFTESEALARVEAQASRGQRLAAAGAVIDNNGTLAELEASVHQFWVEQIAADVNG
jgi:dephospho-CoA kinase